MTEPETPAYAAEVPSTGTYDYDAFLSYSRADTPVAEGIQKGLHRIGRKMGRLHALRVFRDKTDLAASPSLWDKIRDALDKSRYLVVVLSPSSAGSEWVNKEVDYWLEHRGRDNLVLVLADGTVVWDDSNGRFDPQTSTAALPALAEPDALGDEPIYIDISEHDPWNIENPIFRDKITDIAAPIHGKPKYELASEDLKEQQRFRRFRRLAIAGLAILTVLAVVAATLAFTQRREALAQRNEALAGRLATEANAIFKGLRGGTDDLALQELTVAARLSPDAARSGLLSGLQATAGTDKIIRTEHIPTAVAVTPDGTRIVSVSKEEWGIRVWDAKTGAQVAELPGHPPAAPMTLAVTPDGKHLLTSDTLSMNALWNIDDGTLVRQFDAPRAGLSASQAQMSADGTRVAASLSPSGPDEDEVFGFQVWDIATGMTVGLIENHPGRVRRLALSPDGHRLVTADTASAIRVWDVDSGEQVVDTIDTSWGEFVGPRNHNDAYDLAFSPDGRRFVAALNDHTLRMWDTDTGAPAGETMTGHIRTVFVVAFSPDGKQIASGGMDESVRIWDAETGHPIGEPLDGHSGAIQGLTFTPDSQQIVSTSIDHTIRVSRADPKAGFGGHATVPANDLPPRTRILPLAPGGQHHSASSNGPTAIWNLDNNKLTSVVDGSAQMPVVNKATMTPDGRRAAFASWSKLEVWDLDSGERVATIEDPDAGWGPVAISPDGTRVAQGLRKGQIKVFDADTGQPVAGDFTGLAGTIPALRFSPDSRQLVAGATGGLLQAFTVDTGEPLGEPWSGSEDTVRAIVFSPDAHVAASAGDKSIFRWDADTHQPLGRPLTGHTWDVQSMAFSHDGTLLVSASPSETGVSSGEVRIWDVASGQQLGDPLETDAGDGTEFQASDVAFNSDSTEIFAADAAAVWQWPGPARWLDLLCNKLSANMTREQWREWVSPDVDYVAGCPDLPIPE